MNAVQHWHSVQTVGNKRGYCPHMCKAGMDVVFTLTVPPTRCQLWGTI